jgi:hypothetical protein
VGPASGLETIGGWVFHEFRVADFVTPTSQTKLRFIAEDAGTGSIVEGGHRRLRDPRHPLRRSAIRSASATARASPPARAATRRRSGHGCGTPLTGGALLTSTGTPSLSADSFVLTSSDERSNALSIFLQGDAEIPVVSYGDGLRCAGGSLKRLYTKNASGGVVTAPTGGDPSVSARSAAAGDPISPFGTRIYQVYYRDPNSFTAPPPGRHVQRVERLR